MKFVNMQKLATEIHQQCVDAGWWKPYPDKMDRFQTARMLINSEITEGFEGWRKDLMDDHLPQYKMLHVEMGDALIRLFDLGVALGVNFGDLPEEDFHTLIEGTVAQLEGYDTPEQLDVIVANMYDMQHNPLNMVRMTVIGILGFCEYHKIDVWPIIDDKRAYNGTREDHKEEVRAQKHGKKV